MVIRWTCAVCDLREEISVPDDAEDAEVDARVRDRHAHVKTIPVSHLLAWAKAPVDEEG